MKNDPCKRLLFSIARLHDQGYGGLRIMPIYEESKWTLHIGPRLAFSIVDGSFAMEDLRSRCLTVKATQTIPLNAQNDHELLALLYLHAKNWSDVTQEALSLYKQWIEASKVQDKEYSEWFLGLCAQIAIYDFDFPSRVGAEAASHEQSLFSFVTLHTNQEQAYERRRFWKAPPPGRAGSSGPWKAKYPEVAFAALRPPEAPNLLWTQGSNHRSDSNLDNWWENSGHAGTDN